MRGIPSGLPIAGSHSASSKKRVSSGKASRVSTNEAFFEADLMRGFVIEESACERVSTEGMHGATIDAIGNEWARGEELKDGKGVKRKRDSMWQSTTLPVLS